ncbi:MAG TPA: hypothetical protein VFS11_02710 [Gemmatimonadales bacterium]|nr:hypothetical protein [Gemmatimonadales bacterium]
MYASIRTYTSAPGAGTQAVFDELRRQLEHDFVPRVQEINGFHAYFAVRGDRDRMTTISIFETEAGAAESTRRAAEFVRSGSLPLQFSAPDVVQGNVFIAREAAMPAM